MNGMGTRAGIGFGAALALVAAGGALAQPAPRGTVRVEVTANGTDADAQIELLPPAGGTAAATGAPRTPLAVPPGTWNVRVTLTGALDRPARTREAVAVAAGAETSVRVDFEVAEVAFACRKGTAEASGEVRIRRPGASAWLPPVACGRTFLVSGGTYEAQATVGGTSVQVEALQIVAGAVQRLPITAP